MPIFNLLQFNGAVRDFSDLCEQASAFIANCPGDQRKKYVVAIIAGCQVYFYGVFNARSHSHAKSVALQAHQQVQTEHSDVDCAVGMVVLGACQKQRCRCGGRMYVSSSLRASDGSWGIPYDDPNLPSGHYQPEFMEQVIKNLACMQRLLGTE